MVSKLGEGALELDIQSILDAKGTNPTKPEYSVFLNTVDKDMPIKLLDSVELLRDYNTYVGDYILATFHIGMGDYISDVLPYRDNLEATIIKKDSKSQSSTRYKFAIVNNQNYTAGDVYDKMSKEDLNKSQLITIEGQCLDRHIETLRTIPVDGIFKFSTILDVFRYNIDAALSGIKIGSKTPDIDINIITPNNDRSYDHIEVPTGTKVLDLATYLQQSNYGVYNGAVGTYFQLYGPTLRNTLFIYPLYTNALFKTATKKLIIYKASTSKFDVIESTYFIDGDIVKIIAGSNTKSINKGENELLNTGYSIVASDPNTMLERNALVDDDSVVVSKDSNLTGLLFKTPSDGNPNPNYVGMTDNLYKYRSEIMKKSMSIFQVQWNHSDPDLIYPGMPVMYVFADDVNGIRKMTGTVQSTYSKYLKSTNERASLINIAVSEVVKGQE
jgi:hypothetical protein